MLKFASKFKHNHNEKKGQTAQAGKQSPPLFFPSSPSPLSPVSKQKSEDNIQHQETSPSSPPSSPRTPPLLPRIITQSQDSFPPPPLPPTPSSPTLPSKNSSSFSPPTFSSLLSLPSTRFLSHDPQSSSFCLPLELLNYTSHQCNNFDGLFFLFHLSFVRFPSPLSLQTSPLKPINIITPNKTKNTKNKDLQSLVCRWDNVKKCPNFVEIEINVLKKVMQIAMPHLPGELVAVEVAEIPEPHRFSKNILKKRDV